MNTEEKLQQCEKERKMLEQKIADQDRLIDDQCDTIIELTNTLDARDVN